MHQLQQGSRVAVSNAHSLTNVYSESSVLMGVHLNTDQTQGFSDPRNRFMHSLLSVQKQKVSTSQAITKPASAHVRERVCPHCARPLEVRAASRAIQVDKYLV